MYTSVAQQTYFLLNALFYVL